MTLVEQATAKGARFQDFGAAGWRAILIKRGRLLPTATFLAPTKDEAARMWLNYTKGRK